MPTIHHGDRFGPNLMPRTGGMRLLPPATGPGAFERTCTLTLVANGLLALWVYFLVPRSMDDPDIWWHLRNASVQWHSRTWLHHDLYSSTASGAVWINHEWLAEVPFYLGWRLAGTSGLYAVTLCTIEFILLGVFWLTRLEARSPAQPPAPFPTQLPAGLPARLPSGGLVSVSLLTAAVAALLATVSFGPRMLLFGWACLVVELLILQRFHARFLTTPLRSDPAIFALPLLFLLWVNLHGSWLIGLVLFMLFILAGSFVVENGSIRNHAWNRSQWKALATVLGLSVGALFINPYGWHLVLYPFDMAFQQPLNIASAQEWKPLDFQTARGVIFLCSLGALFLAQLTRRLNWTIWELAFVAIGIYAGCRHSRFLFLGAILVMPLLGRQLTHAFTRHASPRRLLVFGHWQGRPRPWLNATILAAMVALTVLAAGRRSHARPPDGAEFPIAALPYLRHFHPQGRLFNEYLWGGYLAYNAPRLPVFIDSRMDIFERNGTLRDYLDIIYLRRSLDLLDQYQVRYVLFEKDAPLIYLLQQTRAWQADYEDSRTVLLERRSVPEGWSQAKTSRDPGTPSRAVFYPAALEPVSR